MEKLTKLNYVDLAESTIKSLIETDRKGKPVIRVTNSKIRNLLTTTNVLYNDLLKNRDEKLNDDLLASIQYLRMKFAYECGRDKDIKNFIEKANLMRYVKNIGESREAALLFCNYMEALVAYHKYHGGKDR